MATIDQVMTEEEFLALPEAECVERELIRGELRERPMTTRACAHSLVICNIIFSLKLWVRGQPEPRGRVVGSEARVRLRSDQATFVGVDVALIAAERWPDASRRAKYFDGPPVLVAEVLSPSDQQEDIADQVARYLEAGVPIVWIVDPLWSTVTVHGADAKPQLFNTDQELSGEPSLPGLRVAVATLFEGLD